MDRNINDELTDAERAALASLEREAPAPAELEDRTVQALRQAGLLTEQQSFGASRRLRIAFAAAAVIALFAAGVLTGRFSAGDGAPPDYVMLLRAPAPTGQVQDEKVTRGRVQEYTAWARAEAARGRVIAGERLADGGRLLSGRQDIPTAGAGEDEGSVQGFFMIRAASEEEAWEVARGCPHMKYGGTVEVRRIERSG